MSWRIYFWIVNLSAPWRRGHDHPTASPRQSLQCKSAGQLSMRSFLYLPMACFFMRFTWRCCPPSPHLEGSEPTAVLALGHVCCSANPPVLASHWATSLRLSDLAVCREGFSRRHGNGFILPPITHPFKVFDWPGLPRRRGGDRARDYGMRNGPREKERLSWATSQLIENPAEFFMKIEKLLNFFFVALSSLSTVLTFGLVCAVSLFNSYLQWSQRWGWN